MGGAGCDLCAKGGQLLKPDAHSASTTMVCVAAGKPAAATQTMYENNYTDYYPISLFWI